MTTVLSIAFTCLATFDSEQWQEGSPAAAIRTMHELIENMEYERLYTEHFHKNVHSQISKARFVRFMASDDGEAFALMFKKVKTAIDDFAREDVLIARAQDMPSTYEFILVAAESIGRNWHLEFAKEDGKWLLSDFD